LQRVVQLPLTPVCHIEVRSLRGGMFGRRTLRL
jgi:hypothetical protein